MISQTSPKTEGDVSLVNELLKTYQKNTRKIFTAKLNQLRLKLFHLHLIPQIVV